MRIGNSACVELAANAERVYADNYPAKARTHSERSTGGSSSASRTATRRLVAARQFF